MNERDDEPENLLRRWSRRKQAAKARARDGAEPSQSKGAETGASPRSAEPGGAEPPAFDPTTLPPIESITGVSDVRAFLAPRVPVELSRAALRRAWMTDPAIRNFVGLAENQWDFTAPEFVPGFGALELTPAVRRMVAELIASARDETASPPDPDLQGVDQELQNPAEMRPIAIHRATDAVARGAGQAASGRGAQASDADLWQPSVRSSIIDAATQRRSDEALEESKPARRRHGSALPK